MAPPPATERAGPTGPTGAASPTATGAAAPSIAGSWTAVGVAGRPVVTFGTDGVAVTLPCGHLTGGYHAAEPTGGRPVPLAVGINSFDAACFSRGHGSAVDWLTGAGAYRVRGTSRVLDGIDGHPITTLVPATRDPSVTFVAGSATVDTVQPAPLPPGLTPATGPDLLGRWVARTPRPESFGAARTPPSSPPRDDPRRPSVTFNPTSVGGTDGCNDQRGAWSVGPGGRYLGVGGASTAVGCDGEDLMTHLDRTARVGFDGTTLVLLDRTGGEVTRLVRG